MPTPLTLRKGYVLEVPTQSIGVAAAKLRDVLVLPPFCLLGVRESCADMSNRFHANHEFSLINSSFYLAQSNKERTTRNGSCSLQPARNRATYPLRQQEDNKSSSTHRTCVRTCKKFASRLASRKEPYIFHAHHWSMRFCNNR